MRIITKQDHANGCRSIPTGPPRRSFLVSALITCVIFMAAAAVSAETVYNAVTGPCYLEFPADHGAHPGYRTEWWYYTGSLGSQTGEKFGFQLTFFRSQISPPSADRKWPQAPSGWRTQQLFLAHAAVTDITGENHYHAEKISRAALAMAGVTEDQQGATIFLHNWSAKIQPDQHLLAADSDSFSFRLTLKPRKPPVAHGDSGYSRKGQADQSASCYYSLTRLEAGGEMFLQGKRFEVSGLAWMDHEYSSAPLESNLVGWDWFSLQFTDETELMIYLLRQKDGAYSSASSGTFVKPDGNTNHLTAEMFSVDVLDKWKSPASGANYPAKWRLQIPRLQIDLIIQPNLANQEMRTPESTRVTYWEGSVSAGGSREGRQWSGSGYVELTGYERDFDAPM